MKGSKSYVVVTCERYERRLVRVGAGTFAHVLAKVLAALGYKDVRRDFEAGTLLTARDESGIPTLIVVDLSPVVNGYPLPRVSPAREDEMRRLCLLYLQEHAKTARVRADYVALPSARVCGATLPLTQRRGIAWAYARERIPYAELKLMTSSAAELCRD